MRWCTFANGHDGPHSWQPEARNPLLMVPANTLTVMKISKRRKRRTLDPLMAQERRVARARTRLLKAAKNLAAQEATLSRMIAGRKAAATLKEKGRPPKAVKKTREITLDD